jgi:FAD:protein FMN transferase
MEQITFRAMGSQILAILDTDNSAARAMLNAVSAWFAGWERALSRFDAQSELSALNRKTGQWVRISPMLASVIHAALQAARTSAGLVTPTLLPALEAIGYDRDFSRIETASAANAEISPGVADWRTIQWNARQNMIRVPPGVRLDLGGIAKGWAADLAARRLGRRGPALVDAGGDIAVSGPRADGSPWPIGVSDPQAPDTQVDLLFLSRGGVATSGRDYRRWQQGTTERHHLIDPRTGLPAVTDLLSATVIAPTTVQAEVAAKAALILGSAAGGAWLKQQPELAALLIRADGAAIRMGAWEVVAFSPTYSHPDARSFFNQ